MSDKQFSCDSCDLKEYCSEPKRTIFNKLRYWSYKGACGHYGRLSLTIASEVTDRTLDPQAQQTAVDKQKERKLKNTQYDTKKSRQVYAYEYKED